MSTSTDHALAIDAHAADLLWRTARSANSFADVPVTDAQIDTIMDLLQWGPTSMNSLPLRVTWVRTPEARETLVTLVAEGNRAKTASAPVSAVLAYDPEFFQHLSITFPHSPDAGARVGANPERAAATANNNAWLQAGYFILAVRAAGLAAGPIGGFDVAGVDAAFHRDNGWRSFMVVNVGLPGEGAHFGRLPRLPRELMSQQI